MQEKKKFILTSKYLITCFDKTNVLIIEFWINAGDILKTYIIISLEIIVALDSILSLSAQKHCYSFYTYLSLISF